ncbi:hypothetical protein [Grimontia hollisae]|uniref:hypothetical protein n=1 Tax=Grimontia hollisae TaxID=673 RepID=UPI0012ACA0EF|nr:hypothetical protein [Grimontia hollisae]
MSEFNETDIHDEELTIETHSEAEEKAFVANVANATTGADDGEFDPSGIASDDTPSKEVLLESAAEAAVMYLGVGEAFIKRFGHKDFAFDEELAENFGKAAAPLLLKYDGDMPPWMKAYKEEIGFVAAAGLLGLSSWSQIKALKAQDIALEAKEAEEGEAA